MMNAHEVWEYNEEERTQTLKRLICLCTGCHEVKHFGRSRVMGKQGECLYRIMEVNEWTEDQAVQHLVEVSEKWEERSKYEWTVDLTMMENYLK